MSRGKRSKSLESKDPQLGVTTARVGSDFCSCVGVLAADFTAKRVENIHLNLNTILFRSVGIMCASYFGDN